MIICDNWYHSDKNCSGLKKTLFNNIGENDQWACLICISRSKVASKLHSDEILAHKVQLQSLNKLNLELSEKNLRLTNDLNFKEAEIKRLKDRLSVLEGGVRDEGSCWSVVVDGCRPRGREAASALQTSNSFEVLSGEEHMTARLLRFPTVGP